MIEYPLKTYAERRKLFLETTKPYKPTDGSKGSWAKRKDDSGTLIIFKEYGTMNDGSWEIDHIKPKCDGGSDDISNLRALSTNKNRQKGGKPKDPFEKGKKGRKKQKEKSKVKAKSKSKVK